MDDHEDQWEIGLSTSSKRTTYQPPSDNYIDVEESESYDDDDYDDDDNEDDDDGKSELACPFCSEDFDVVGLCCHIDDRHLMEVKYGICPVCATQLGTNMVVHVITQHEKILKALCKKKLRNGESRSVLSLLRKELQDKHLESLSKKSSYVVSSSNTEPDPLLLSFIHNPPPTAKTEITQANLSNETSLSDKSSTKNVSERNIHSPSLSDKDQENKYEENAQRCEFVRGLLFSTILDDDL